MNDTTGADVPIPYNQQMIDELVRGLDPVDWVQLRLTATLAPFERILAGMRAQTFARATLRGAFRRRFPDLSPAEINMKVLAYLTPVRIEQR